MRFKQLKLVGGFLALILAQSAFASSMIAQWDFDDRTADNSATDNKLSLNIDADNNLIQDQENNKHYFVLQSIESEEVYINDVSDFEIKDSFGASFWIKDSVLSNGNFGQLLRLRTDDNFLLQVVKEPQSLYVELLRLDDNGNALSYAKTTQTLESGFDSQWKHIAFSVNFTVDCYNLVLYVDGQGAAEAFAQEAFCNEYSLNNGGGRSVSQMHIGGAIDIGSDRPLLNNNKWLGKLDDLRIYKVSLTDNEVLCLGQYGTQCVLGDQRGRQGISGFVQTNANIATLEAVALGSDRPTWQDIMQSGSSANGKDGQTIADVRRSNNSDDNTLEKVEITLEDGTPFEFVVTPNEAVQEERYNNTLITAMTVDPQSGNGTLTIEGISNESVNDISLSGLNGAVPDSIYTIQTPNEDKYIEVVDSDGNTKGMKLLDDNDDPVDAITTIHDYRTKVAKGQSGNTIKSASVSGTDTSFTLNSIGDGDNDIPIEYTKKLLTKGAKPATGSDQKGLNDFKGANGPDVLPTKAQVGTAAPGTGYDYFIPLMIDGIVIILPPNPDQDELLMHFSNGQIANVGSIRGEDSDVHGTTFDEKFSINNVKLKQGNNDVDITNGQTYESSNAGTCGLIVDDITPKANHTDVDVKVTKASGNSWTINIDPERYSITNTIYQCQSYEQRENPFGGDEQEEDPFGSQLPSDEKDWDVVSTHPTMEECRICAPTDSIILRCVAEPVVKSYRYVAHTGTLYCNK